MTRPTRPGDPRITDRDQGTMGLMPQSTSGDQATELLERSDQLDALEAALDDVVGGSRGRLTLVAGEAGAGKTVLIQRFCDAHSDTARVLWGACDALLTPGPLGPFLE